MGIVQKLAENKTAFSLEFSPPKKDMPTSSVYGAIEQLAQRQPAFASVTYGAGGGNRDRMLEVVSHVDSLGLEAIAHLTCVGADPSTINVMLGRFGIQRYPKRAGAARRYTGWYGS